VCIYLHETEVILAVFDLKGGSSFALDGVSVIGSRDNFIATIKNGFAHLPAISSEKGVVLKDLEGKILRLSKRKRG